MSYENQATDAGAPATGAAADTLLSTMDASAMDGGSPPSWLVDGIAAAGGVTTSPPPVGTDMGARDAGGAPAE